MKTILTFFFIVLFSQHVTAQALYVDSTRFITGTNRITSGTDIYYSIPTADKGILFVGEDYGNPGGIIPVFTIDEGVNGNVLIGKIDSNQQISWIKVYGGTDADGAGGACQTSDGGYAILCNTSSSNGDVTGYKGGGSDIWLLRIDAMGNLLWEKTYGSSAEDGAISIANTIDNGFIILGMTNGSDDDVPFHYGDFSYFDWLVIKADSAGNKQWSKDIGGTGDEGPGSILPVDGSYYIVCNTNSTDYDCIDTAWHPNVNTFMDYHVLKLDDTGRVLWDSSYGGTQGDAISYAMFDSRDSTIIINGVTNSSDYMVTGYQGGGDMWVIKVKKDGTLTWAKTYGTPGAEKGTGLCETDRGYMAYGVINGVIGDADCWLIQLDNSGNSVNSKVFGGTDVEKTASVVPYLGGYAATGVSGSYVFTEGSTYGNFDTIGGAFVSYIDSTGNVSVPLIKSSGQMLTVHPNPAKENIVVCTVHEMDGFLTVVNVQGQIVYRGLTEGTRYANVSVRDWSDGVYFICFVGADGSVQTGKFIKQ